MTRPGIAVLLGLAAAGAYGVSSVIQHREAARVDSSNPLAPGLLVSLAKRPAWRLGLVADASAVALQAAALRFGAVVLVQLLVVGALPIAVLLSAVWPRSRLPRRQLLGLLLCTGGLALALPASTAVDVGHPGPAREWLVAATVVVVVVVALVLTSRRSRRAGPLTLGAAAGVTAGASSVLLAVCAAGADHPLALLRTPAPYGALVLGLVTLSLTQAGFQTGAIGAPLAMLSITEPAAAVVLAVTVLHQHLPTAPADAAPGAVGALVAVAGVVLLTEPRRRRCQRPGTAAA